MNKQSEREPAIKELSRIFALRVATAKGLDASYFEHDVREWLTKHLGADAGVTTAEEERRDFRWALDDMKYNGRTAIAGRLEGLYLRLTPGKANHD